MYNALPPQFVAHFQQHLQRPAADAPPPTTSVGPLPQCRRPAQLPSRTRTAAPGLRTSRRCQPPPPPARRRPIRRPACGRWPPGCCPGRRRRRMIHFCPRRKSIRRQRRRRRQGDDIYVSSDGGGGPSEAGEGAGDFSESDDYFIFKLFYRLCVRYLALYIMRGVASRGF
jgi:hypothetical protein